MQLKHTQAIVKYPTKTYSALYSDLLPRSSALSVCTESHVALSLFMTFHALRAVCRRLSSTRSFSLRHPKQTFSALPLLSPRPSAQTGRRLTLTVTALLRAVKERHGFITVTYSSSGRLMTLRKERHEKVQDFD